jgi:F0F1-type ATP synthase assembly protein I
MRRPEVLFFIAVILGVVVGKLIKNFKIGMFLGLLLGALLAFGAGRNMRKHDK